MLYEVRAYTFTQGSLDEAIKGFRRTVEERVKLSRLICFFRSAIGDLDRMFHIWEYENSAHRESARDEAQKASWWPPLKAEKILYQQTRLMAAASFRLEPRTGAMGGFYEIRSDTFQAGTMEKLGAAWAEHLPEREKLSPLAAAFANPASEFASGILNEFLHIWPYRDLNHWAEVDEAAGKLTGWRDCSNPYLRSRKSEIWRPVDFSPMC
ncbi:MAG: NIPSNAP family protein [Nitrospinota bacterium]|jgi:hypothetical protein|nr:NIPSNAP family protein [Nitrospinota bacterium]MDP7167420.1 NIPSNAP family protein [Nitrospinota bacterium]MDP7371439.1 NIPSNAP family protein [Nitrospinota bacterium]MDP7503583.1 NIPSNAP family protein [Nitrospinota bacterium]MDP7663539.1 NIPSNAP family protein [Nitrospinota bacterium]